jgi:hypothetical protein
MTTSQASRHAGNTACDSRSATAGTMTPGQNGGDLKEVATGVIEPNGQLVLTLKEAEQSASKGDIVGLSAQLKAMQASLELLAASR